jgi:universal stress protein E
MIDVRRMLVAIDLHRDGGTLTAGSCFATDQAAEFAKHLGAEVVLVHSTRPDWAVGRSTEPPAAADSAKRTLDQVADRFRAIGVSTAVEISDETPWRAIIRRVLRDRIHLVFAGRRNEQSHAPLHLGSVSSHLLRRCPCAVWVAKPECDLAPRRVLAASDLSPVGERVIDYAAFIAGRYHAELHVVHAFQLRRGAELEGWTGIEPFLRRERDERARRLTEQVDLAGGAPSLSVHAVPGSPAKAILDLNAELKPDLVVMGTVSRGRARSRLVGNTALRVLGKLDGSLLAVKPEDFVCPVALSD